MENLETLDLSGSKIKKLNKPQSHETHVTTLILDDNELQRLDNIDSFTKVQKISAVRNQLLRMYGVCRLHNLHTLNLAHNGILTIEGLKDLVNLKVLCLAGNTIKTIEHLNTNINLEHLDISENSVTHVSDVSFLKNLKDLLLHGNKIGHLRQCEKYLPTSLVTLTLAANNITDLNEISQLVNLCNLNSFSIANNPCVNMTANAVGFDYRPFVINWCMSVKIIDGYVVDAIESLRAEWLYSQGRGRHFRVGDHQELIQYLASVCPLTGEALESEEDRKLRLILSKAQHHQQQLRDQLTTGIAPDAPSPVTRRRLHLNSNKSSPRLGHSRRSRSPDRMASSCYNPSLMNCSINGATLMTQSLDATILSQSVASKISMTESCCLDEIPASSPLQAATKLVPVPDSLMSPDYRPPSNTLSPPSVAVPIVSALTPINQRAKSASSAGKIPTQRGSPKLGRTIPQQTPSQALRERPKSAICRPVVRSAPNQTIPKQPPPPLPLHAQNHQQQMQQQQMQQIEDDECNEAKLQTIRCKAEERKKELESNVNTANQTHQSNAVPPPSFVSAAAVDRNQANNGGSGSNVSVASSGDASPPPQQQQPPPPPAHHQQSNDTNASVADAAVKIQKLWRGYYVRNKNKDVLDKYKTIQANRAELYIQKLATEVESTKVALESERKIQMLQMQAINALWKKVSALPSSITPTNHQNATVQNQQQHGSKNCGSETVVAPNGGGGAELSCAATQVPEVVKDLAQTCAMLHAQVQQLQGSMQDVMRCMTLFCQLPREAGGLCGIGGPHKDKEKEECIATQTEIIAVHTPQGEAAKVFPFQKNTRPSSLPLPITQRTKQTTENHNELRQFAGNLVEDVIKTVSETSDEQQHHQQLHARQTTNAFNSSSSPET